MIYFKENEMHKRTDKQWEQNYLKDTGRRDTYKTENRR